MSRRILIPTDFSDTAFNALRYALRLYKQEPCTFYLLHAFQISGYSVDSPLAPDPSDIVLKTEKEEAEQALSEIIEKIKRDAASLGHEFEAEATYNSLLHAVKSAIAAKDIDLVIMGTKGITGAESLIFGTNAINIMEGITTCPVMSIPGSYGIDVPWEIVFPTDYKGQYDRKEFNSLLEIASCHNAPIRVLYVEKDKKFTRTQEGNKQLLDRILSDCEHSFHSISDRKVHRGIGQYVKSRESNLIAFMNRKHGVLDHILSRPLVKELGYHYKIPILALNEPV